MSSQSTDHELLEAWRAGNEEAGTALVRRHFATLSRFFRIKLADERAELMQRTWLGCAESRDRVPDHVPFRVYLLGIARRVLIHHYRHVKREANTTVTPNISVDGGNESPSMVMALADEEKLLLQALRQLPLDMQLTLELFYWEGLQVAEVAEVLEIPPGTVKSRLSRAKGLLREQVATFDPPPDLLESTQANLEGWAKSIRRFLDRE